MAGAVRIKDLHKELRMFLGRSVVAAAIIAALSVLLIARLVLLQIIRYDYYTELAQGNRARLEPIPANRGLILDRNGTVLAENQPSYQLELVREQVPDLEQTLKALSSLDLIPADELDDVRRLIRSHRGFETVPIRLRLTEEQIARFAVYRNQFPGVEIQARSTRFYPRGAVAVHALGYVGAISESDLGQIDRGAYVGTSLIGKLGVEAARETELHGRNGFQEILVNAQGRSVNNQGVLGRTLRKQPPTAGTDLILSLDLPAQEAAEKAFQGRRGAAIALDPHTGDVLVLASMPGFDPGIFGRGITRNEYRELDDNIDLPLFNRALRGIYPPGSTVKPVLGMAGLAYGVITAAETRFCPGVYHVPNTNRVAREGRGGVHGTVDMRTSDCRILRRLFLWTRVPARAPIASTNSSRPSASASSPASISPVSAPACCRRANGRCSATRIPPRRRLVCRGFGQLRHRPGLHVGDAHADGAGHCSACRAGRGVQAAPGHRRARPGHRQDNQDRTGATAASEGRHA